MVQRFSTEKGGPTTQQRPPSLALNGIHVLVGREGVEARRVLEQHSRSSFDLLKLWPPKSYFFSPSRNCVIAYAVANKTAISLGDPVGPEAEIELTAREFLRKFKKKGWGVAFYRASADYVQAYRRLGLRKLKIGDDALVNLEQFSLKGRLKRDIRSKANHFEQLGMRVVEYQPPLAAETLAKLADVEEQWLSIPGRRERTFAVGHFDRDYLRSTPVLAVMDGDGRVLAFVNVISANPREIAGDVMRRGRDVPNGITDYLLLKLIHYAGEKRYNRVSLGLAPMSGFKEAESAGLEERVIHRVLRKLDFLFRFRGLSQYKAKFATSWEPRYLIYENLLQLPRTALALVRLSEIKDCESVIGLTHHNLANSGP
jgi:phosphatidylglycerol lysyltransferase